MNPLQFGVKMDKIEVCISDSLKSFKEIVHYISDRSIKNIKPSEEYNPEKYSLLILNKKTEGLYSGVDFRSEPNFDVVGFFDEERNNKEDIIEAVDVLSELLEKTGVLNFQQIQKLIKMDILIYEPKEENLKAASYDLTLNREHLVSGIRLESGNKVVIDPLDFLIVRANESANLPRNICATFDLLVSMFCRGIILSNGPQVDPGYRGRFLCLLFNSSSKKFMPKVNNKFCTIIFHSLQESTKLPYSGKYQKKESISDYVTPYADASISSNIGEIHKLKKDFLLLKDNTEGNKRIIKNLEDDVNSYKSKVDVVEEKNKTWWSLAIAFLGFIIALFFSIAYFDIYKDLGTFKAKYDQLSIDYSVLKKKVINLESAKISLQTPVIENSLDKKQSIETKKKFTLIQNK